jgi:hypothetical protein
MGQKTTLKTEAAGAFETLVNSTRLHSVKSQKTVISVVSLIHITANRLEAKLLSRTDDNYKHFLASLFNMFTSGL